MNVKIKSSGVYCPIANDYERYYASLSRQLGDGEQQLFTERTVGHEYLQWELPGDGWSKLSDADPIMAQEARRELKLRRSQVMERFANNQEMAQILLSVPDDSFVYYKADDSGRLVIRLTAWGYRYPERVAVTQAQGTVKPAEVTEPVTISFVYDGRPMAGKPFKLNSYQRAADGDGKYDVGNLPVGYQFDIDVDDRHEHVTVMPGQGNITLDLTQMTAVEVRATLDGQPYAMAQVTLSYKGREYPLTTDAGGRATASVPLDPAGSACTARLESEVQQKPLTLPLTTFTFDRTTPDVVEPVKDPVKEPEKQQEPVKGPDEVKKPQEPVSPVEKEETNEDKEKPYLVVEEEQKKEPEPPQPPAREEKPVSPWAVVGFGLGLAGLVAATYAGSVLLFFA